MICYKDKTFCNNPNCQCHPDDQMTEAVAKAAERWWGKPGAPICVGDLCGGKPNRTVADGIQQISDDVAEIATSLQPKTNDISESVAHYRIGGTRRDK